MVSESKALKFFAPYFSTDAFSTFRSYWGETGERLFPHTPEVGSIPYEILASKLGTPNGATHLWELPLETEGELQTVPPTFGNSLSVEKCGSKDC